jgi:hypothetical protein
MTTGTSMTTPGTSGSPMTLGGPDSATGDACADVEPKYAPSEG